MYKIGTDIDDWLALMVGSKNFGCQTIDRSDLPLDMIKIDWFDYIADEPFTHVFNVPMEESEAELVLYAKGTYVSGEVTLLTTEVTRFGFTVKAPIDCRVDFIIGYKND